ncbi:hypothetical protein [Dyadobacter pollutisoli]|uniref:HNH endonuclease n=1 Tax=Dyadobacter pollutisoli TaxID=2910158 RepID=A0A9E8NB07_9BACT|nr:hypothetical protein [Dyadobacter pollutisoli]WAC11231.1 hypothetical protein ON006_26295 [Dyadobacter pollutisoli]
MTDIQDYSDERLNAGCIYCGSTIEDSESNHDHVPSRSILERPLPAYLPKVQVCIKCNSGFSFDEEYFISFLSCLLSGTTDPSKQEVKSVGRALVRNPSLRTRIEDARSEAIHNGETRILWNPEWRRINNVILKNARGHAFHELGLSTASEPNYVRACPLELLDHFQRRNFEETSSFFWPEVGSRILQRLVGQLDLQEGWVIVQKGVYRYSVVQDFGVRVRTVIRDYLATEVYWSGQ